jgi:hypothetical protein
MSAEIEPIVVEHIYEAPVSAIWEAVNGHLNLPTFGQTFSPPPLSFADVSNR